MTAEAPDRTLIGRLAVVTGSTRGIGHAIAARLAASGATVVITGRDEAAARSVAADLDGRATGYGLDVRSSEDVQRVVAGVLDQHGRIDVLVNNAGIDRDAYITRVTDEMWSDVLDTNLTGAFRGIRAVVPTMKRQGRGVILNVLSWSGLKGNAGQAAYSASKAGLHGLTLTAAKELGRFGIRVNGLAPSMETDMVAENLDPDRYEEYTRRRPLGRPWATAEEVAAAAHFLVSDQSSFTTGQLLHVDGGLHLN